MDWTLITTGIISALMGSGGAATWFNYRINKSKQDTDNFTKLMELWEEDNERLRRRVEELEKRLNEEITRVQELQIEVQRLLIERNSTT